MTKRLIIYNEHMGVLNWWEGATSFWTGINPDRPFIYTFDTIEDCERRIDEWHAVGPFEIREVLVPEGTLFISVSELEEQGIPVVPCRLSMEEIAQRIGFVRAPPAEQPWRSARHPAGPAMPSRPSRSRRGKTGVARVRGRPVG